MQINRSQSLNVVYIVEVLQSKSMIQPRVVFKDTFTRIVVKPLQRIMV